MKFSNVTLPFRFSFCLAALLFTCGIKAQDSLRTSFYIGSSIGIMDHYDFSPAIGEKYIRPCFRYEAGICLPMRMSNFFELKLGYEKLNQGYQHTDSSAFVSTGVIGESNIGFSHRASGIAFGLGHTHSMRNSIFMTSFFFGVNFLNDLDEKDLVTGSTINNDKSHFGVVSGLQILYSYRLSQEIHVAAGISELFDRSTFKATQWSPVALVSDKFCAGILTMFDLKLSFQWL